MSFLKPSIQRIVVPVGFAILSLSLLLPVHATPWQEEFALGDTVEFTFMRDVVQGDVIGFTGTGWPTIQFEHNGRTQQRFYPPSRLTLVEKATDPLSDERAESFEFRTWTDATGNFSVTAKLVSDQDDKVELEKKDGRIVSLPLAKLSQEDQAYLKKLQSQSNNPFAGGIKKDNPFAGGDSGMSDEPSEKSRPGREPTTSSRRPSKKSRPTVNPKFYANEIVLSDRGWAVQPDAAAPAPSSERVINTKPGFTKYSVHNRNTGVALSSDKQWIGVMFSNPFEKDSEILVADTVTGKSKKPVRTGLTDAKLLAISPDGSQAVTVLSGKGRQPGQLDFWDLEGAASPGASWTTSNFFEREGFAPSSGRFLDEAHLLTFGRRVILWDCDSATAKYSIAIDESCQPANSSNGKQTAIVNGNSVYIIDSWDGSSLGKFTPPMATQAMAYSNDGQFLAGIDSSSGSIWVWDLSANELAQQLSAPPQRVKSLEFVDGNYLLINGSNLVDIDLATTVWKYRTAGGSVMGGQDGRFWFVGSSKLIPIQLPHVDLKAQSAKYDPVELRVLEPGSEIELKLELPFSTAEQTAIREQVSKSLAANQISIRNGADLSLTLSVSQGKQETAEMSSFMDPLGRRGTEKIKFTPQSGKITLRRGETSLWTRSRRFGPGPIIHMKKGESAQAAADRLCRPDASFFKALNLPAFISQFPNGQPLGQSTISESGIR